MSPATGLQLGDRLLVWSRNGQTKAVNAHVSALVREGQASPLTAYLLTGDETQAETTNIALPRSSGYRTRDAESTRILLQACFARVRHELPAGGAPPLTVAVPFWCQEDEALVTAAHAAKWGAVTVVTDLYAVACFAAARTGGARFLLTLVPGVGELDAGLWEREGAGYRPLAWETMGESELNERLHALSRLAHNRPVTAVLAGDLSDEWLGNGLTAALERAGATLLNLGEGGVAEAATAWGAEPPLPLDRLHFFLETGGRWLLLPRGEAGTAIWRALGRPDEAERMTFRIHATWGEKPEPSPLQWQHTRRVGTEQLLLRLGWEQDDQAAIELYAPGGERLHGDRFSIRPR